MSCNITMSPLCASCTSIELKLGTCGALAENQDARGFGVLEAWAMFLVYLFPIAAVFLRRTTLIYIGVTVLLATALGALLQGTITSDRPEGVCYQSSSGCGFPSGHVITSYSTLAIVLWVLYFVRRRSRERGAKLAISHNPYLSLAAILVFAFLLILMIMQPLGRTLIFYHTTLQVGVGVPVGIVFGSACFLVFDVWVSVRVAQWLRQRHEANSCSYVHDDWMKIFVVTMTEREGEDTTYSAIMGKESSKKETASQQ